MGNMLSLGTNGLQQKNKKNLKKPHQVLLQEQESEATVDKYWKIGKRLRDVFCFCKPVLTVVTLM